MMNQKRIMTNLTITNEPLTMSSLEIAKLCDKQHKDVMRDIKNMMEQLDINTAQFCAEYKASNGKLNPMYNLDKELSLTLVAGYNVKLRNAIIKRWQELENNTQALPNFTDPAEAAIAWAGQYKQNQTLQIELKAKEEYLAEVKPMVAFAETIAKSDDCILMNALAHLAQNDISIKIGERRLWDLLRNWELIQKSSTLPTQKAQELGIFSLQERIIMHNSGSRVHITTKINGKGQQYIINKLKQHFAGV